MGCKHRTIFLLLFCLWLAEGRARSSPPGPERTASSYDRQRAVRYWINYLRNAGVLEFRRWTRQMGHYAELYQSIFAAHGVAPELVWLSGMESGCDRNAVSSKGAAGLWQFLPTTARNEGLRVDKWVDERFEPQAATRAAARHLSALYQRFRSWPLVLAAYHTGETWVARQIRRFQTRDYFKLARLRAFQESTQIYVPKALAFLAMASRPGAYGVSIPRQPGELREDLVVVPRGTRLKAVAKAANLSLAEVRRLNPALRRAQTPPIGDPVAVRLPRGTGWRVVANLPGAHGARRWEVMARERDSKACFPEGWEVSRSQRLLLYYAVGEGDSFPPDPPRWVFAYPGRSRAWPTPAWLHQPAFDPWRTWTARLLRHDLGDHPPGAS